MRQVRGTRKGAKRWPRKVLLDLVIDIGSLAASRKDTDPLWPVVTANMVAIYRNESAKIRAIDDFNVTAGYGESKSSVPQPPDPNEEDFD